MVRRLSRNAGAPEIPKLLSLGISGRLEWPLVDWTVIQLTLVSSILPWGHHLQSLMG